MGHVMSIQTRIALALCGIGTMLLLSIIGSVAIAATLAGEPVPRFNPFKLIWLLFVESPSTITGLPATVDWVHRTTVIVAIAFAIAIAIIIVVRRNPTSPEHRPGFPGSGQVARIAGRATIARARHLRPDLQKPTADDLGVPIGSSKGVEVWMSIEDTLFIQGPPRSGKGTNFVIPLLVRAPGCVVTTSVRPDNVKLVTLERERAGHRVHIFDPGQLVPGIGRAVKWDPLVGCDNDETVRRRVDAMMPRETFATTKSGDFWAASSQMIIGSLMHAAALREDDKPKRTMRDVWRWLSDHRAAKEAIAILERHPSAAPGWGAALSALLSAPPEQRASKWDAAVTSVNYLSYQRVQDILSPEPGEGFNPWTFIERQETLFLLDTVAGDAAINRIAVMLFDEITNCALELAAVASGERLCPPAWFVLDEAANFVIPNLPRILSYFGGSGLVLVPIFQDLAQARTAYGNDDADAIIANCTIKVFLPGRTKARDLEELEKLIGSHEVIERSRSVGYAGSSESTSYSTRDKSIITAAEIAGIPKGYATVLYRSSAFIMKLRPYTSERWSKRLGADRRELSVPIQAAKQSDLDARRAAYDA